MNSANGFFLFVIALLYHSILGIADTIQGCGGFVEASSALIKSRSPATAKLDYSHVTVELRTLDGLVKDQTQCAPNGYYFIPIYDKGSFVIKIKGPEGWSYAPEQVPVLVDHTGCNANEDINFRFTGFTLSGRVVGAVGGDSCVHKSGGPLNVNVELLSAGGDVVSSVLTSSTGSYLFKNIIPGKYNIRASHRDLNIEVKGSAEVELGFDNGVVDDIFFVSGYDIRGLVVAQENPILGVHFYLYSDDVLELDCPYESGNAPGMNKALCHSVSDADGMFTFKSIPCGIYNLVPFYKGENTIFDVSPPSLLVSVQHDHAIAPQKFQVTGFSVGGRVVDDSGTGVDAASIVVDGQERSITDKEGYYKIDQVTSKRYSIEAKKDHYKFEKLNDFLVLPNMASIADIKAVAYDLCGIAQTVSPDYKAKVALTHGPENVKPQVKQTDESGNFCFEVPPGEYRLSAFAATPDSAPELLFSPPHIDVNVNKPLLSVKFYQAQVNVRGSVVCKEKCGSSISVVLVRLDGNRKEERISSLINQGSEFIFSNILPGKYRVEVKNHSPSIRSGEDIWCWEQNSINVDVGGEDVNDITFIQKGFMVSVISSHEVDSFLITADGSRVKLKIKKGSQRFCLESPGGHELQFVDSCISFGSNILRFDTYDLSPIYLKGEKYLLKGQINVESNESLPDNIPIDILDNGLSVDGTVARVESSDIDQGRGAVYSYSVWANFGRKLIFVPRDSRNDGVKKMLFYPRQQHVSVTSDGCQVPIASFSGRLGLYFEGSVLPPLSHVHIRVVAQRESHISLLKKGDIALETMTGADGLFLAGPLYDDISYSTEASKCKPEEVMRLYNDPWTGDVVLVNLPRGCPNSFYPGYYVKKIGSNSFSCQKLGQISVRLHFKEDINDSFPSVLLSLSGEDGYRNNSITGVGGTFVFDGLFPGSFYLRPLLKEYAFSPPAQPIEIGSGESKEVAFHATRVAFSALGKVTLLSGQPKNGVYVEARAESKGFYEETKTDISGSFRLRGLQPETTYVIKVARKGELDSTHIERASPGSLVVKIGYEDVKDLDFVVFEQPDMTILSGHVEGKNIKEMHSHIRVEIRPASDPSTVETIFPLPISNFFQVKDLPKGKHLVQLRSALPSGNHRFVSEVIEVDLERQPQIHVGPLSFRMEEDMYKQELTPAPVYPLVVGLSVIALFISMPRLKDLYQAAIGISLPGSSATAKKDVKKPSIRKKTY